MSATLDRIAPHPPAELLTPAACDAVRRVTDLLPAALARWIYLECRLAADTPQVDLIAAVEPQHRALLAAPAPCDAPSDAWPTLLAHPIWRRVQALCRTWADPSSVLHERVERIWLEFDADAVDAGPATPVPGVFVDFTAETYADDDVALRHRVLIAALAPLFADALPTATARALRRCLRGLPRGAHVIYTGHLPARGSAAVRLCIQGIAPNDVPGFLRTLGWLDAHDGLARLIADLSPAWAPDDPTRATLHLDVDGARVLPAVSLEYPLRARPQLRGVIEEAGFLDHLVALGLAAPGKRRALDAWPGFALGTLSHELSPTTLVRRVNHVKLVYAPGRPAAAKGYLCLFNKPRASRTLRAGGRLTLAGTVS